jgi:hypothetical protein
MPIFSGAFPDSRVVAVPGCVGDHLSTVAQAFLAFAEDHPNYNEREVTATRGSLGTEGIERDIP